MAIKRSQTIENAHGQEQRTAVTLNYQERLETFESERRNVLERIVENVHRTVTFTCYNYCKYNTIIYKINFVPNHQRFKKFT